MKILVIDDNKTNQAAAKAQLKNHETTIVGSYDEGQKLLQGKHKYEVVLADLLMPASRNMQGPKGDCFVGKEMPVGIFLALLAAKNGAKHVAVFTDSDHHSHPASACFDAFNEAEYKPTPFRIEKAKVILCNNRNLIKQFRCDDLATELTREERGQSKPSVETKDWKGLLEYLIALKLK